MRGFAFASMLALVPVAASAQEAPVASTPRPARVQHAAPAVPPAPARRELGKWWKDSDIAQRLQLTPAQVNQIEASFLDYRLKLIDLRADLERQETKLQPLIEADQPDEAKVSAQMDLVVGARGKLEKANTMMMLAMRRALSPEQWKKLQAIQEERGHRMPGPAPMAAPAAAPMPAHARPPDHATPPYPPRPPNDPDEDEDVSALPFAAAPRPPLPR